MMYQTIYPLADALQIELQVYRKSTGYEIRGGREFRFPLSKGAGADRDLVFKTKVEASYAGSAASSVLLHIRKDLYIFVYYEMLDKEDNDKITLHILDASKTNIKTLKNVIDGESLNTALMAVTPITVAAFWKGLRSVEWEAVCLGRHNPLVEGDCKKPPSKKRINS